jgi:hypothetical protein
VGPLAAQKQKAGIKGLVIEPWFGVFVPAAAIIARLNCLLSYGNFSPIRHIGGKPRRTCAGGATPLSAS